MTWVKVTSGELELRDRLIGDNLNVTELVPLRFMGKNLLYDLIRRNRKILCSTINWLIILKLINFQTNFIK